MLRKAKRFDSLTSPVKRVAKMPTFPETEKRYGKKTSAYEKQTNLYANREKAGTRTPGLIS